MSVVKAQPRSGYGNSSGLRSSYTGVMITAWGKLLNEQLKGPRNMVSWKEQYASHLAANVFFKAIYDTVTKSQGFKDSVYFNT